MRERGFTPIIIILVVVLISAIGYFVYTKGYITQLFSKNAIQKTITPSPYPINDITANWEIFNGKEFQFKYPPTWLVEESFSYYFNGQVININNETGKLSIEINFNQKNKTFRVYANRNYDQLR